MQVNTKSPHIPLKGLCRPFEGRDNTGIRARTHRTWLFGALVSDSETVLGNAWDKCWYMFGTGLRHATEWKIFGTRLGMFVTSVAHVRCMLGLEMYLGSSKQSIVVNFQASFNTTVLTHKHPELQWNASPNAFGFYRTNVILECSNWISNFRLGSSQLLVFPRPGWVFPDFWDFWVLIARNAMREILGLSLVQNTSRVWACTSVVTIIWLSSSRQNGGARCTILDKFFL